MFSFAITPLGNLFFALTLLVFVSLLFMRQNPKSPLLLSLLFIALGIIFYADNLLTLFIGWEVMSWSSYLIIKKSASKETSIKYMLFNIAGAFALLLAIMLLYGLFGSFSYGAISLSSLDLGVQSVVVLLLLVAIFIKSGVVPFHFWIPDSYSESDDLFSTLLSSIISKVGIFLFLLLFSGFDVSSFTQKAIFEFMAWAGVITSIIATFKAISQDEMKKLLAYSSIAQLGYIITIFAILSGESFAAGIYHTVIHSFTKLLLFANIATIIYVTKEQKFSNLGGLMKNYPLQFILLTIGIIALAGMPPLGGFSSKFMIYTVLLDEGRGLLLAAVLFSSASAFLYCYKLVYGIYLGQPTKDFAKERIPVGFYIPQILGAVVVVVLGLLPSVGIIVINPTLQYIGFEALHVDSLFELQTIFASFNGGVIMGMFVVIFALLLLLLNSLRNRRIDAKDRFDISYCGEVPNEHFNLHYGYGMGQELRRIGFIKKILENSSATLWGSIVNIATALSLFFKQLYTISATHTAVVVVLFFTLLLYMGVR